MRTQEEVVAMFETTKKQLDEIEEAPRTGDSLQEATRLMLNSQWVYCHGYQVIRKMENDTYKHLKRCNNCNNWINKNYFDSHFCVGRAVDKKVEK